MGCRCEACRAAHAMAVRAASSRRARVGSFYVDSAPVRDSVRSLVEERGFSQREVARATGMSQSWVSDMLLGHRSQERDVARVTRETAAAVLGAVGHAWAPGQLVDAGLFREVVLGYLRAGVPPRVVAEACGITERSVGEALSRERVRASTVNALLGSKARLDAMAECHGGCGPADDGVGVDG